MHGPKNFFYAWKWSIIEDSCVSFGMRTVNIHFAYLILVRKKCLFLNKLYTFQAHAKLSPASPIIPLVLLNVRIYGTQTNPQQRHSYCLLWSMVHGIWMLSDSRASPHCSKLICIHVFALFFRFGQRNISVSSEKLLYGRKGILVVSCLPRESCRPNSMLVRRWVDLKIAIMWFPYSILLAVFASVCNQIIASLFFVPIVGWSILK